MGIPHHHQLDHRHQLFVEVAPEGSTSTCTITCQPAATTCCTSLQSSADPDSGNSGLRWRFSNRGSTKWRERAFKVTKDNCCEKAAEWITRGQEAHDPSQQRGKKTVAEKQPNEPPKAKKHKSTESDEDDEEPRNESGTSSNTQPTVPILRYNSGDEDSEHSSENSARSQDSGRTVFHPDLNVLTDEEHFTQICRSGWIVLLFDERKWRTTRYVQFDHYAVCATIIVSQWSDQRLREHKCWSTWWCWWSTERYVGTMYGYLQKKMITCTKGSISPRCPRKLQQFAEAKHLEYRSWADNEVFDLIHVRKVKPRNYVTVRWVLTIKTDKQGNFLKAIARWVLRGFQDKQKEYQQTDFCPSTRPGFRMSCHMAARKGWDHIDLKTAFLLRQSCDVNRDVLCQFPQEAGHPPYIVARLENPYIEITQEKTLWGTGRDPSRTKYEGRSPPYWRDAYKAQETSGTDKFVAV